MWCETGIVLKLSRRIYGFAEPQQILSCHCLSPLIFDMLYVCKVKSERESAPKTHQGPAFKGPSRHKKYIDREVESIKSLALPTAPLPQRLQGVGMHGSHPRKSLAIDVDLALSPSRWSTIAKTFPGSGAVPMERSCKPSDFAPETNRTQVVENKCCLAQVSLRLRPYLSAAASLSSEEPAP